ncbi:hypothetical protein [Novosphingobium sp. KACC 22771]|uniref:hypothetical protein n=1 Tax=Novosphingobium sp. KACC 22771 TaxID=3025670 RepID=UPI0023651FF6|nr:hypothetical protein [Novosphingobium sp. KACC 22771]WDF70958.1 hypothetical protein PQ467_08865 [Novosphingobium sp. KACC 22771]
MTRRALLIATGRFADPQILPLQSPITNAQRLATLLSRADVGGYAVTLCLDEPCIAQRCAVQEFFDQSGGEDTNLILVTGHGIKDKSGLLHFAASDTRLAALNATSLDARYLIERMNESMASRQVLFLDTCYSGSFGKGVTGKSVAINSGDFSEASSGNAVITASTAIQQAGESAIAGIVQSLFTRHLIEGIESGQADTDRDGRITLNELFDYIRGRLRKEAPNQTPQPFNYGLDGATVLVLNPVHVAASLPEALLARIAKGDRHAKGLAVEDLHAIAAERGSLEAAAIGLLKKLAGDDSMHVCRLATDALADLGVATVDPESADSAGLPQSGNTASQHRRDNGTEQIRVEPVRRERNVVLALCAAALLLAGLFYWKPWQRTSGSSPVQNAEMPAGDTLIGAADTPPGNASAPAAIDFPKATSTTAGAHSSPENKPSAAAKNPVSSPAPQVALHPYPDTGPFNVVFDWTKADISGEMASILDTVATVYAKISDKIVVRIDAPISPGETAALGKQRGAALKAYLIGKGVPASSIQIITTRRGPDGYVKGVVSDLMYRRAEIHFYTVMN